MNDYIAGYLHSFLVNDFGYLLRVKAKGF